jgi:hypothetical protein
VIISSAMKSASNSFASERTAGRKSSGGITLPAVPCIGSTMKAAMDPAPAILSCLRPTSTQASPHEG